MYDARESRSGRRPRLQLADESHVTHSGVHSGPEIVQEGNPTSGSRPALKPARARDQSSQDAYRDSFIDYHRISCLWITPPSTRLPRHRMYRRYRPHQRPRHPLPWCIHALPRLAAEDGGAGDGDGGSDRAVTDVSLACGNGGGGRAGGAGGCVATSARSRSWCRRRAASIKSSISARTAWHLIICPASTT